MTKVRNLVEVIEEKYPKFIQESYDNSGLITGEKNAEVSGVLLSIDINEKVVDEAIASNCNFIIAHHPVIFHPLKKLTGSNYIERTIIKAIKNDIAIYAAHTSVDNNFEGLNKIICDKIGLKNYQLILPKEKVLNKLVVFVPNSHAQKVRNAIFEAGAGHIGNYDNCSFNIEGTGTFRAGENTQPFVGNKNELHAESEVRIETVFPVFLKNKIVNAMTNVHPYEEVAYDIYSIENKHQKFGTGMIGELEEEIDETEFLKIVKDELNLKCLKHSELKNRKIKKVAICTGACHFLINSAIMQGADVFISSEFKYDQYISAQNQIVLVDAGHYETEIYINNVFYEFLTEKFATFAVKISESFKNPVKYL
ncbi:MAG: Nif3-like dinuclear metal center hexameric protein [Bacteroidota bacterium]|nr:Nif3-like dinuclear metal center hexameric protein [Bacteroidota bacterium]